MALMLVARKDEGTAAEKSYSKSVKKIVKKTCTSSALKNLWTRFVGKTKSSFRCRSKDTSDGVISKLIGEEIVMRGTKSEKNRCSHL